jgi:hypothetical protein
VFQLGIMIAGCMIEVAGLLGYRTWYSTLLAGAGGIIIGLAQPDALGIINIVVGVLNIITWLNRRRRDRAPRQLGEKSRALIAAMTRKMRQATQPA